MCLCCAPSALADFGFKDLSVRFVEEDGAQAQQAGSHPFAMETELDFNTHFDAQKNEVISDAPIKDLVADLPPGLAVDPHAVPQCSASDFANIGFQHAEGRCSNSTALGVVEGRSHGASSGDGAPVYNLVPSPGVASKIGFHILGVSVIIEGGVRGSGPRNLFAKVSNQSQAADITRSKLTLWGNPADPAHDSERGRCLEYGGSCETLSTARPFFTLPGSCSDPLLSIFNIDSWLDPGSYLPSGEPDPADPAWVRAATTSDEMVGCGKLG